MRKSKSPEGSTYTCEDYRAEMTLLGLQQRLRKDDMEEGEREDLLRTIRDLEKELGLD
jgi:hypothetical protein